ncbi:MAG: uridine kinase [Dehalococcoidia bacterium]
MHNTDPQRRVIVSICGPAGSGKTVLSKLLVERLGPDVAVRVPSDRYLMPAQEPLDRYLRRPVRYDWPLLDRALDVPDGTAVLTPSFDFRRFTRREQPDRRPFITRPVLVIDAIKPYPATTIRVYIDAPSEIRRARLIERDAARGSRSADQWEQLELTRIHLEQRCIDYDLLLSGMDDPAGNVEAIIMCLTRSAKRQASRIWPDGTIETS